MNVKIESNFATLGHRVWLFEREPFRVLRSLGGDHWRWDEEDPSVADIEPSIVFGPGVLQALLEEAGQVLPATHATERHLLDAIDVRDRVLTLLERDGVGTVDGRAVEQSGSSPGS